LRRRRPSHPKPTSAEPRSVIVAGSGITAVPWISIVASTDWGKRSGAKSRRNSPESEVIAPTVALELVVPVVVKAMESKVLPSGANAVKVNGPDPGVSIKLFRVKVAVSVPPGKVRPVWSTVMSSA